MTLLNKELNIYKQKETSAL